MKTDNVTEATETKSEPLPVAVIPSGLPEKQPATPQQMRVVEVSEALAPAYQKASTLELTEAEINGLMLPFPDEKVEVRPHDGLIYIPHIHISNRLNQVFNPGKWALICRRHWLEGNTMYGEYILLIRGCYVGESVGGHPYQPNNPKVNYSDTLESTAAEALRRIAGKRLSCGSQVWDPDYARRWCDKYRGRDASGYYKKQAGEHTVTSNPKPPKEEKQPPSTLKMPTAATRKWMIDAVLANPGQANRQMVTEYFQKVGQLLATEQIEDLPLRFVPYSKEELTALHNCIGNFESGGDAIRAFAPHGDAEDDVPRGTSVAESEANEPPGGYQGAAGRPEDEPEDEEWRSFPMPHGKHAGNKLEDLEKNYLFGLWANYKVETSFVNKDGKTIRLKPETVEKNRKFREMLDQAGTHYEFRKKD